MTAILIDMILRWKGALLTCALLSVALGYGIVVDPEMVLLDRAGGRGAGINTLILASLWGSLLVSIDTARGTVRVWATLPVSGRSVASSVWILSVLVCPAITTLIVFMLGIYAGLSGRGYAAIALAPLTLAVTIGYAGFAHILLCEQRNAAVPDWWRNAARLGYLMILGGSYFLAGLYPADWGSLYAEHGALILVGWIAGGIGFVRTSQMISAPKVCEAGTDKLERMEKRRFRLPMPTWGGGPLAEGLTLGIVSAMALLLPAVFVVRLAERNTTGTGIHSGLWTLADSGFSIMVCLTFAILFVAVFASHPWLIALRTIRSLPFATHRVALLCFLPALAAVVAMTALLLLPLRFLLTSELAGIPLIIATLVPGLAIAACGAFLRWGYAVVMTGVFGLLPLSIGIRQLDPSLLSDPPILPVVALGGLIFALGYTLLVHTIVRSAAAYRHKHVPWF